MIECKMFFPHIGGMKGAELVTIFRLCSPAAFDQVQFFNADKK
jgi:hypothetical protein